MFEAIGIQILQLFAKALYIIDKEPKFTYWDVE